MLRLDVGGSDDGDVLGTLGKGLGRPAGGDALCRPALKEKQDLIRLSPQNRLGKKHQN